MAAITDLLTSFAPSPQVCELVEVPCVGWSKYGIDVRRDGVIRRFVMD
jgi:hypothetical protein